MPRPNCFISLPPLPNSVPNSFCIAKNQPDCHYSVRLLTGPRADSASKRASKGLSGKTAKAAATAVGGWDGSSGGGGGNDELVPDRRYPPVLPLKRWAAILGARNGIIALFSLFFFADGGCAAALWFGAPGWVSGIAS